MKEKILAIIGDSVTDLLYYDRKEDDELPIGAINEAVKNGEITIDEMVAKYREQLENGLKN